jgi:hypothetical protein
LFSKYVNIGIYIKKSELYVDFRSGGILKKHLKKLDPKTVFSREFFFF